MASAWSRTSEIMPTSVVSRPLIATNLPTVGRSCRPGLGGASAIRASDPSTATTWPNSAIRHV